MIAVINLDETTLVELRLDPAWENGGDTDGDEADLGGDRFLALWAFDIDGYRVAIILEVDTLGIGEAADSLFGEGFLQLLTRSLYLQQEGGWAASR